MGTCRERCRRDLSGQAEPLAAAGHSPGCWRMEMAGKGGEPVSAPAPCLPWSVPPVPMPSGLWSCRRDSEEGMPAGRCGCREPCCPTAPSLLLPRALPFGLGPGLRGALSCPRGRGSESPCQAPCPPHPPHTPSPVKFQWILAR